MNIIENNEIQKYKNIYENNNNKLKISNFLQNEFADALYRHISLEKNWNLASGIDTNKYEKQNTPQFEKINNLQIKNVNTAFTNNRFSYCFYRAMNNSKNVSFFEFNLRKILNSKNVIDMLNEITGLNLKGITTLFLSKYKSGNFLSPHSDKGNGRLAFVINLTKFWKPQYGGNLHFMNDERTEITDTFTPEFNNFVIFNVPEGDGVPHYVSHVVQNLKVSRYAVTGWFE
jgi:SM-20-related protein